ncbi:Bug family tripartite tricarboxylate transporter substrate binding protein [Pseudogemmobacter sonorensis]|uniref:Bug family tripartite tricarboxylate transporter substrate binding protein n=1 Tax=Pseudogemmobacter sonorensis TaxID=2989681 RepID=UPI00367CE1AD
MTHPLIPALIPGVLALALPAFPALAADWPTQPVRIIVSFPPGGGSDLVARLLAQHLTEDIGQQVVVENKPGAAGTIAASDLKSASADGHTLMLSNLTPFSIAPTLIADTPYDPLADFTHVSYIGSGHMALFVTPALATPDLNALIEKAKAEPGGLDYGTSGVGSWGHLVSEQFKALAGVEAEHIPYQGSGPMVLDLRAGVIPMMFDAVAQNLGLVTEGVAVPLAVTSRGRLDVLPDTPSFTELGLDLVAENWLGISAPAGLDAGTAAQIDAAVKAVLAKPEVVAQFAGWGVDTTPVEGEFTAYVAGQLDSWKSSAETVRGQ